MKSKLDPLTTPEQKMQRFQSAMRRVLSISKNEGGWPMSMWTVPHICAEQMWVFSFPARCRPFRLDLHDSRLRNKEMQIPRRRLGMTTLKIWDGDREPSLLSG